MGTALTTGDVARLLGRPVGTVIQWDNAGLIRPSIRKAEGRVTGRLYSVDDVVCGHIATEWHRRGVAISAIKKVIEHIQAVGAEKLATTEPYIVLDMTTDRVWTAVDGAEFVGSADHVLICDIRPGLAAIKKAMAAGAKPTTVKAARKNRRRK